MYLIFSLLCNSDFPTLAQNVGMASLTILIPVAIVIFSSDKDFRELDNHLILDHIVQAKFLLIYSALMFLPMFFWKYSSLPLRFIEIILWGLGVYFLVQILFLSYKWLKGNKFPLRFDFLRKMTDKKDMEESWNSVWSSDKVNGANENEFFQIFTDRIDKIFKDND